MKTKKEQEMNYKAIFFSGLSFVGAGVVFLAAVNAGIGASLIGLGCVFMIIRGKNQDKWQKKQVRKRKK